MTTYRTARLLLRPFVAEDLEPLLATYSRGDVARYLYQGPRSEPEVRELLDKKMAARAIAARGDLLSLAVVVADTREMAGDCVLHWLDNEHRQGEIGFVVHPDHQGRGYATEAAGALLRIAFEDLELHRVVGRLEARNLASERVLQKLGMRREALFVENEFVKEEWQSELVYAMLRTEWLATRG
ncbi:MAG: GNAT family N-acetyltransferase [Actinomycetota bacterium]